MTRAKDVDPVYKAFGAYLKGSRLAQNVRQQDVATALGTHIQSISYYERGESRIPLALFCEWARQLGLDPGETVNLVLKSMHRRESRG